MAAPAIRSDNSPIQFSCYLNKNREGEQFVAQHVFGFQQEGILTLDDGTKKYISKPGDFRLVRKNHLVKFIKQPAEQGAFRSISMYFDENTLRQFSQEFGYEEVHNRDSHAVVAIPTHPLYKSFVDSLLAYEGLQSGAHQELIALKLKEALLLLLKVNPALKDVLFDFSEPRKIDLEAFMQKNFHFNVDLKRFAYLTGRSLATFKRDFEKVFAESPSRWLLHKRLQEAYYRIKEKGIAPSDVYLDVGFEDLSHFSFAFKKMYGVSPSRV
ncbi:AraC family transcriptional regulator [Paraflavitalea sp. CAU 1676]|uniref:helix-turn-helix domain-containing protein n=1 Tax=Paraflavitalea sp. CAU 1676 TaxID=3032598 RepID=UPI0023DA4CDB|nr:AraC family transcriptional regulator [Paraflavitalea sp. CAU 1676]MDF2188633.1 AraC family transcriptional regulator [Paraflavitalea sp. CAU 1676]